MGSGTNETSHFKATPLLLARLCKDPSRPFLELGTLRLRSSCLRGRESNPAQLVGAPQPVTLIDFCSQNLARRIAFSAAPCDANALSEGEASVTAEGSESNRCHRFRQCPWLQLQKIVQIQWLPLTLQAFSKLPPNKIRWSILQPKSASSRRVAIDVVWAPAHQARLHAGVGSVKGSHCAAHAS